MIYLDHAATTPMRTEVIEAMYPYFQHDYGNPSSMHMYGRKARGTVDRSRELIAHSLHAEPSQIVFTSGGTEADNLAIFGVARYHLHHGKGNHIITSSIEHHAVLNTCQYLSENGFEVTYLPVNRFGEVALSSLEEAITDRTILISVMHGNNETGTIQPIESMAKLAKQKGILFHMDAVQAFGAIPLDVKTLPVDLVSISAHKINGPKGVGALYVSPSVHMEPVLYGGNQERKHRGGTENVPGIVGFAKAVELLQAERADRYKKYAGLRQALLQSLAEVLGREKYTVNGSPENYLPQILNLSFSGTDTQTLLMRLDMEGIAVSSGSACSSGSLQRSHVIKAMYDNSGREDLIHSAIRFSFGYGNTVAEVQTTAEKIGRIIKRTG